jgi:FkbM family methyltransferase
MINDIKTKVLDAGGRYGLHPTWKPFTGELEYYLFEPDPDESKRLEAKYTRRSHEIKIIAKAVAEANRKLVIHMFRNRAMSTSVIRTPISALFKGERLREVDIVDSIETDAVSIDSFCAANNLSLDFVKLDTEGTEFHILQGAQQQLQHSILGVRSEVSFDYIFEGMPLFGTLHEFLLRHDFQLLNVDYDGRGDYQNNFAPTNGRYGVLTSSDAVWVKRSKHLFSGGNELAGNTAARIMKYAAFLLLNNAPDVAMSILLEARREHDVNFDILKDTRLYRFVDIAIHKLLYSLKWQPGQSLAANADAYFTIFGKEMAQMNEYMQSEELNPD